MASRSRHVEDYATVFRACRDEADHARLAIRAMRLDRNETLLLVEPETLSTSLEPAERWTCVDTDDEAQRDTRLLRALDRPAPPAKPGAAAKPYLRDAGLVHGAGEGSYITGDLCPSLRPLDRPFFEALAAMGPGTPVALSISGLWLKRHRQDFEWLRAKARAGSIDITWVNHSYHHPYFPERPLDGNFLLAPGVDMRAEILDTESSLIAAGETPSVFFRFPGLISDAATMDEVRRDHLVTLGADAWLVFAPPLKPGAIVLVHPNGNEPQGLRLFASLVSRGKLPRPFRGVNEAP